MQASIAIELLESSRYAETGSMLARAFDADPAWCFVYPDPARRPAQLAWLFEHWSRVMGPLGACFIGSRGEGAAMWFPPGKGPRVSSWSCIRAGFGAIPFKLGLGGIRRALILQADIEVHWAEVPQQPCWMLDVLGVHPDFQRQGVGAALIRPILERADAEGLPCHVITHNQANIAYYERHGFRLLRRAGEQHLASSLWRPAPNDRNRGGL